MNVDTKLTKDSKAVTTDLTLDWSGVSDAEKLELATRTAVISWQRIMRDAGKIPDGKVTAKVRDLLDGKRPPKVVTPERIMGDFDKLTPEQRDEVLRTLMNQKSATVKAPAKKAA